MAKLKKAQIAELIKKMAELYPEAECALVHDNPFQLLIAVVLSAQTTDKSVNKVTPILFSRYPDASSLASANQEELEEILKPIGMYRTKAKNIVALSRMLVEEHEGRVPGDYGQLTKLPGVGRKTANVVLAVGFGEPRIAVDTHVFPKEHWIMMHHALIWHGRRGCTARNPKCDECGIYGLCCRNGLEAKS